MKKKHLKRYSDFSLYSKISIMVWGLTLLITTLVILVSSTYYNQVVQEKTLKSTRSTTENAANTLNINYISIVENFVSTCGRSGFAADLKALNSPEFSYAEKEAMLQNELSLLSNGNYLVHSSLIVSGDGSIYYSLYRNPLPDSQLSFITEEELASLTGISWLSKRNSPFRSSVSVIPLVFPLTFDNTPLVGIASSPDSVLDGCVIIMLDSSNLARTLAASKDAAIDNTFLLASPEGTFPYSDHADIPSEFLFSEAVRLFLQEVSASDGQCLLLTAENYNLFASKLKNSSMILLNCVEKETFADLFEQLSSIIVTILAVVILILLVISVLVSRYISKPVGTLVQVVSQIENNQYHRHVVFSSNDEIGKLCRAINNMHDTIQRQMQQIKHDEAEKYMAEIKLLTEQINPHFLYNTLDCIQFEVKCGNSQNASNMIQSLAEYMRIGLSNKNDLITIANELRHVHAYIRIMNQRFQQSITFMYKVDPALEQHTILKSILQPLVENSIKHGFYIDNTGIPVSLPAIEINFYCEHERLHIQVTDNGAGFDVEKTKELLYHDSNQHVGLHNVYTRLAAYYGKDYVICHLSSIPYYSNTLEFCIPLTVS